MSHQFTGRRRQGEVVPSPDTSCVVCGLRYRHHPRPGVETGAELIAAERQRQIEVKGYTPEHDAGHRINQFTNAAVTYVQAFYREEHETDEHGFSVVGGWPWRNDSFHPAPTGDIRNLVKAGALIAAAIDASAVQ